ncbi:uncharacterized protein N7482_005276 [Penicillium canariense]|uniref:Cap binding protein n=1 Tax=Penicillium canariense TaxID=189055 RepID=A0A9W9LN18_9EURO|nr:uncharacterized protein N7482_005276 [Penicillium canariense]KAJ5166495.1 hypothetical protein N7482_005276 [Penicillium canariense]
MADYERRNSGHRGVVVVVGASAAIEDYDRRPQRRRYEEPLFVQVRRQLLTIAESAARRVEDDVVGIAKSVAENYDDEELRDTMINISLDLVLEQPMKIPFVAATALVAHNIKPELGAELLQKAVTALQKYIDSGSWREVKLLIRFLGCLQPLFEGDGIFPLLEELFARAVDLQTASSEDLLGMELVKIILFTIPYVMSSSATGFEAHASALLEKTDIIASTPHALVDLVNTFSPEENESAAGPSLISVLQTQLQNEASQGWELKCLPRPWKDALEAEGDEQKPFDVVTKVAFPQINVPNPVPYGPRALFPEVYLSVYANQEVDTVPSISDIASSLLRDALVDTINLLDFNRVATAKYLIDVDCYYTRHTFVKRATPFDRMRDMAGDNKAWKPEDVAVDAVFSQLFQLPTSEHKLVYYHALLTECCKIAPAAIAPSLGRAIRFLYNNVETMDLELSNRFLDWFAHHLSNFGFTWKWSEWVEDLERPAIHPKMAFILGALDKEIRLSFAQRIKGTLPEQYLPLITESKEKDTPEFKYLSEGMCDGSPPRLTTTSTFPVTNSSTTATPYSKEGQELMQLIRKKAGDDELQPVIASIEEQAQSLGVDDPKVPSTDALMTSICFVGSKSLSHVLSCIERNKDRLLAIGAASEKARCQIITSVMEYWADQPGIAINIVDKLLNYTIISPLSVLEWALIEHIEAGAILSKSHIYEMISATVGKVTNRMRQIVAARTQKGLYEPQLSVLDETLSRERVGMQALFKFIEDSLVSVAAGSNDELMERGNGSGDMPEDLILRQWGRRWLRVFRRKAAVEEAFISDALLNATPVGTIAPVQEEVVDTVADGDIHIADADGP